jgi:hypothetical protein
LFERSELVPDPVRGEHRRVPVAKRRDDEQGRLFFGYFLLAKQKQSDLPPGNPRLGRSVQRSEREKAFAKLSSGAILRLKKACSPLNTRATSY